MWYDGKTVFKCKGAGSVDFRLDDWIGDGITSSEATVDRRGALFRELYTQC